jgi:hypothetical protein
MIKPRAIIKAVIGFTLVVLFIFPVKAFCQDGFEKALSKKLDSLLAKDSEKDSTTMLAPNDAPQTLTIPSGYGGYGTYLFGALGGAYPQVYHTSADLIASGGMSIGNPFKAVNFAAGVNMTDVHRFRDFSGNFIVSRIIGNGSSISAGALQLFAPKSESDAPGQTYYMFETYLHHRHWQRQVLFKKPGRCCCRPGYARYRGIRQCVVRGFRPCKYYYRVVGDEPRCFDRFSSVRKPPVIWTWCG